MWTKTTTLILAVFVIAFAGYVGIHRLTFKMPEQPASAEAADFVGAECGFTPADFSSGPMSVNQAWWTSFTRKQDYFSAFTMALTIAFASYVISKARLIGVKTLAGSLTGGGLLAGTALCLSWLAPILAVAGIGLFANVGLAIAAIPKWAVALATTLFVAWGFWYVSRQAIACRLKKRNPVHLAPSF